MNSLVFRAAIALVLFSISITLDAKEPRARASAKKRSATPQALFVVFQEYEKQPLPQPLESTRLLTEKLLENGYGVTILTDERSHKKLNEELLRERRVHTAIVNTPDEATEQITQWQATYFEKLSSQTPFGFIFLIGHGQTQTTEGVTRDYFMTPSDETTGGGICIQQIADSIGAHSRPIVCFVDMCRLQSSADTIAAKTSQPKYRSNPSSYDALIDSNKVRTFNNRRNGAVSPTLIVWSAQPGRKAHDSGDLVSALAHGLTRDRGVFAARGNRIGNRKASASSYAPLEGRQDLSLFTWYSDAIWQTHEANGQIGSVSEGLVDPMMICASSRTDFVHTAPPLDMLPLWKPFAPSNLVAKETPGGVEITRPANNETTSLFAVSFFGARSIDWAGKTLVVEATATLPQNMAAAPVSCLLIPGDNTDGSQLRPDWDSRKFAIPCTRSDCIPLLLEGAPSQKFRSFAVSVPASDLDSWPKGAAVRISQLTLVESQTIAAMAAPPAGPVEAPNIELLPRWWGIEMKVGKATTVVATQFKKATAGNSRALVLNFQGNNPGDPAGRGGHVFRAPHVDPERYHLKVAITGVKPLAASPSKSNLEIVVEDATDNLVVCKFAKAKLPGVHYFDFAKGGVPERINIITTGVAEITISEITLTPK